MALKQCPECGKEVSDKAETCPHCGVRLISEVAQVRAVLILVIVAIIGLAAIYYYRTYGK